MIRRLHLWINYFFVNSGNISGIETKLNIIHSQVVAYNLHTAIISFPLQIRCYINIYSTYVINLWII